MTRTSLATILIASVAGAAAGMLTSSLWPKGSIDSPVVAASDDGRVAKLEQQNADLQRAIADLRDGQALLASSADRTAVRAEPVATNGASLQTAAPATGAGATTAVEEAKLTLESALAQLMDPDANYADRIKVWEQVVKAGLLDQVVNAMEQRAEREPNNPALRVDLGNAYLQQLFAGNLMKRGYWGTKADEAFDAALKLDPQHWEARFTKAVSLSNWPAFTGKQSLAITEFETLIGQQNAGPKKPDHAKTYLYLGNMYQASGSMAKAVEAWQKGADLFPEDVALKQQIASAGSH